VLFRSPSSARGGRRLERIFRAKERSVPFDHDYVYRPRGQDDYSRGREDHGRGRELALERDYAARPALSDARVNFIRLTYAHLAGAILAFIALEAFLLSIVTPQAVIGIMGGGSAIGFLFVMAAFLGASFLAQMLARSRSSPGVQYLGLGLYVVAEAVIMLPLLYIATYFINDPTLIPTAGILTLAVFGGLTVSVFLTRKDFSGLYPILCVGSLVALGVIIAAVCFGFTLGLFFALAMVALMCGFILYETSNIMLSHPTDMHVAAALMLFSSIATLFYYILYILMLLSSRR